MKKDNQTLVIVLVVILTVLFFGGFGMMGSTNYSYGMMGGMWFFGLVFMILVVVALVEHSGRSRPAVLIVEKCLRFLSENG